MEEADCSPDPGDQDEKLNVSVLRHGRWSISHPRLRKSLEGGSEAKIRPEGRDQSQGVATQSATTKTLYNGAV
jgi:hypothetical protein